MVGASFETLVDWGVDYVTATANEVRAAERIGVLAQSWLGAERAAGNDVREWAGFGYIGLASGSCQFGSRADSVIVRITGPSAAAKVKHICRLATNISRLDCQVTARLTNKDFKLAEWLERRAKRASGELAKPFAVRLLRDSLSGNTLYLGRRTSDRFMRVYDKHKESKLDHYEGCWRAEIQYNGKAAWATAMGLLEHNFDSAWLSARVSAEFERRGVLWPCLNRGSRAVPFRRCPESSSDDRRRIRWLETQVKPTVDRLVQGGHRDEVMRALGLLDQKEEDDGGT